MGQRSNSEPACRVCGCTEHNACADGCSWVKVETGSPPLCSACSGTAADMREAIARGIKTLQRSFSYLAAQDAVVIGRAAILRRDIRAKAEANNPDKSWGGR